MSAARTSITKAVIPAAGLGTRFLPVTKAVPKEMLPVIDKPAIQYVVEEAADAGLLDVLMVTARNKRPLEDHFDRHHELEEVLAGKGDRTRLARVREAGGRAAIHYLRQGDPRGVGHAVLCAASHIGHQPFAVLLGDDLIDPRDPLLARMIEIHERFGGSVVALMEVGPEQVPLYGCAAATPTGTPDVVRIDGLVEKPPLDEAPSNLAMIGRFLLDPAVFDVLRATPPGRGGELQLTDALNTLAADSAARAGAVHGVRFSGRRYDTGDRGDYLRTIVRLAYEHEELGPQFREWLRAFVAADHVR